MTRKIFWCAAAAVVALCLPGQSLAAAQGIGISPTSQEVKLAPWSTSAGKLTVINDGDNDVTYHAYATDYRVHDDSYHGDFGATGSNTDVSAVNWFGLPKGNMVVKARQEQDLPYTITVPLSAAVGGHYAAVFIETVPPPSAPGSAHVNRIDRVGSLFYLAVGGPLHTDGRVLPLEVPLLQSQSPVTGSLRVQNTGNVHFEADVSAQLSNPFGKVGPAAEARGEVLPGTSRRFDVALPASSPIGLFNVSATVKYIGRTETQSHWMLLVPRLTFIIVSATLLLILLLAFWRLVRRARRKRRGRSE